VGMTYMRTVPGNRQRHPTMRRGAAGALSLAAVGVLAACVPAGYGNYFPPRRPGRDTSRDDRGHRRGAQQPAHSSSRHPALPSRGDPGLHPDPGIRLRHPRSDHPRGRRRRRSATPSAPQADTCPGRCSTSAVCTSVARLLPRSAASSLCAARQCPRSPLADPTPRPRSTVGGYCWSGSPTQTAACLTSGRLAR